MKTCDLFVTSDTRSMCAIEIVINLFIFPFLLPILDEQTFQNLDYIYSQRGRPLIVVDNYLYRKNRGAYWRCIRCTKNRCKSRLILRPDRAPVCIEKHSHGPEKEKIEWGRKVKSTVAVDASNVPICEAFDTEVEEVTQLRKIKFLPRQPHFDSSE